MLCLPGRWATAPGSLGEKAEFYPDLRRKPLQSGRVYAILLYAIRARLSGATKDFSPTGL